MKNNYLKSLGARILSEANDLKRSIEVMAVDLNIDVIHLQNIVKGNCTKNEAFIVIRKMGDIYPIDSSDLMLIEYDCNNSILYFDAKKSKLSSRIFNRLDRNNNRTPFYEYRDTAMSRLAPFKPEWIKELRIVYDSNPYNPDVAYNNGHFMHQLTFFVGPVNFYYKLNDKQYCIEMNTGDSNYITPYIPHTFTSRDKTKDAYIVAVTFGGDVRRAQKELYALGNDKIQKYQFNLSDKNRTISQLISQYMHNNNLTRDMIKDEIPIIDTLLDSSSEKSMDDIQNMAEFLNIDISRLVVSEHKKNNEVIIYKKNNQDFRYYPSKQEKMYKIYPLASSVQVPDLNASNIEVIANKAKDNWLESCLHSYIYNYKSSDIEVVWLHNGLEFSKILAQGDSMYMQPFTQNEFNNNKQENCFVCAVRVAGGINLCTQKELSYFADTSRVSKENKPWFN